MRNSILLASLLSFASTTGTAAAQGTPPGQDCEMHVWTTTAIKNDISGFVPGGALGALETQSYRDKLKRGDTTVTQTLLTPELQLQALKDSSIVARFNIAPDRFILETDPATERPFRKSPVAAGEGCRYGFVYQAIWFEKSAVYGKQLTIFYRIVDRNQGPKPKDMSWYNTEGLKGFDPKADDAALSVVLRDGLRRIIDDIVRKKLP